MSPVENLSNDFWEKQAYKLLLEIFSDYPPSPYEPNLKKSKDLSKRIILFQLNYSFSASDFHIQYLQALNAIGETGFYVSLTEVSPLTPHPNISDYHWFVPMTDAYNYGQRITGLENVTYSENGDWAMIFSKDGHAILVCTPVLLNELENRIPDLQSQVLKFIELMRNYRIDYNVFHDWMKPLLLEIYGNDRGGKLYHFYSADDL